jgi:hypothetical protein
LPMSLLPSNHSLASSIFIFLSFYRHRADVIGLNYFLKIIIKLLPIKTLNS